MGMGLLAGLKIARGKRIAIYESKILNVKLKRDPPYYIITVG